MSHTKTAESRQGLHDNIDLPEQSVLIDPSTYNIGDFCRGFNAVRHRDQETAILASESCRANFVKALGADLAMDNLITYENPTQGHIVTLLMPYTIPERLALLSYLSEYFFLHDDQEDESNHGNSYSDPEIDLASRKAARKVFLGDLLAKIVATSAPQGHSILNGLKSYTEMAATRRSSVSFQRVEDYINYRYDDFASDFILAATMWGMDMDPLDEQERLIMDPLIRTAFLALCLTNDYYSYDVELASTTDTTTIMNGVAVLQRLEGLSVDAARVRVKHIAICYDQEFLKLWTAADEANQLTARLRKLTTALSHQVIGKVIWSSTSLRYDVDHRRRARRRADSVQEFGKSEYRTEASVVNVTTDASSSAESLATFVARY